MFDAAYERLITEEGIPHSIYEVQKVQKLRYWISTFILKKQQLADLSVGYTVVPKELVRDGQSLNAMWNQSATTNINGASYIIQRGAAAIYPEGAKQFEETIDYRKNAQAIKEGLERCGLRILVQLTVLMYGVRRLMACRLGILPNMLLEQAQVITTPGAGFGPSGEGYIQLRRSAMRKLL